jgi:hypothetical protein
MTYAVGTGGIKQTVSFRCDSECYDRFSRLIKAQGVGIGDTLEGWMMLYINKFDFKVREKLPEPMITCKGCGARATAEAIKIAGGCQTCGMKG